MGLLLAAAATLAAAAAVAAPTQPGAAGAPSRPAAQASSNPAAVPVEAVPAAPVAGGEDLDTSGTLNAADRNKALSADLVTLETANLRRLLGTNPDFVYDPHGKRDPMVLPWEQMRVQALMLIAEAERAAKFGNFDMAERLYQMVRKTLAEADEQRLPGQDVFDELRAKAETGLQKLAVEKQRVALQSPEAGQAGKAAGAKPAVQLPLWVRANTNGVIYSPSRPLCLVGPYTLKVGEKVPAQPVDVEVVKIEKRAVTYRVAGETFVVGLEEGE